jgi:RHS repeat-associated protein
METTDYYGMFVCTNDHIDYILTSEGRLKYNDHDHQFYAEYFIKDHLGNVRDVITTDPAYTNNNTQVTDYYPFGLEITVSGTSDNQYKYNGKEFQDEAKLDWLDYGARFYDPVLGRWQAVDRFAENHYNFNPYMYVYNNPLRFIDPDGNDGWDKVAGVLIGTVDNLFGTNLRASRRPTDAADYNNALNIADAFSIVGGSFIAAEGTTNVGAGLTLAPATEGVSLILSGEGLVQTALGAYMVANGAKNLGKNNYGENESNNSETTEEVKTRKDPGSDGATSEQIIEKDADGNTVSKTHRVKDQDGAIIHQHQDYISTQKNPETGKKTTRQFPDEWVKYPKIDN